METRAVTKYIHKSGLIVNVEETGEIEESHAFGETHRFPLLMTDGGQKACSRYVSTDSVVEVFTEQGRIWVNKC